MYASVRADNNCISTRYQNNINQILIHPARSGSERMVETGLIGEIVSVKQAMEDLSSQEHMDEMHGLSGIVISM